MKALFVALVLLLPTVADASDNKVKVPFLFTDDQAVPQTDLAQDMTPSDAIRTDVYLNAPMTRLEYMLTRMDAALNGENVLAIILAELGQRFDRPKHPVHRESVRGFAGYSERSGRVLVGYSIEGMGRPRSPMRDACNEVLQWIDRTLPYVPLGYTLHNTLLGVLAQKEYPTYSPMLQKLATQFVYRVKITSHTEDGKVHHTFACQKTAKDSPVTYDKFSFRLK